MDKFDAIRLFVRIVERQSFSMAGKDLGIPRSSVTEGIKELEARLGTRLLQRTTRQVRPTLDGEAYYQRCVSIIADLEAADAAFDAAKPRGLVRADLHGTLARHFVVPGLPRFFELHPDVRLQITEADHVVDLVREGVDCVLRVGRPSDKSMVARGIARLAEGTFASPDYLERFGIPRTLHDLQGHRMIGHMSATTGNPIPLEFAVDEQYQFVTLPFLVSVANPETKLTLARQGLGLIQVPRYRVISDLAAGTMVEVLADFPPSRLPVYVTYPQSRQLSARVRAFIDWLATEFASRLMPSDHEGG